MPTPTSSQASAAAKVPAATPSNAFSAFLLQRIARNPLLINETPRSIAAVPEIAANNNNSNDKGTAFPSSLDDAQRAVLLQPASAGKNDNAAPAAVTALVQRAVVDAPLLPLGNAHLLHELVWASFVACAEAAKQVGSYRTAIELYQARVQKDGATAGKDTTKAQEVAVAVDAVFGASPLASAADTSASVRSGSTPTSAHASTHASNSSSSSGGGASRLVEGPELLTAQELSTTLAPELLQARLAQAQARLTEQRAVLQRGLTKLRRITQSLHDYDALSMEELRRQRTERTSELLAPVLTAATSESGARGEVQKASVEDAAAQDRKRPRTSD